MVHKIRKRMGGVDEMKRFSINIQYSLGEITVGKTNYQEKMVNYNKKVLLGVSQVFDFQYFAACLWEGENKMGEALHISSGGGLL
jgi:hypothetical protein